MAFTFIMQNIAANLGGMLTPFGNPQNLYLYTKFQIPNLEFIQIMAPPFLFAIFLITLCCLLFVKPEPLKVADEPIRLPIPRVIFYLLLFALSIAIVFRGIPHWIGLIVIPIALLFTDRKALKMVDYPLLLTFVFFFIFAGNMARIELVRNFFSLLMDKSTLLFSVFSCQVISNVPAAVVLSGFTDQWHQMLAGVNIGGLGMPIASLASLITIKFYMGQPGAKITKFLAYFMTINLIGLAVLLPFCCFI
jgi:Na+/H+ antiporter NhaD/arsenite permease-like protein